MGAEVRERVAALHADAVVGDALLWGALNEDLGAPAGVLIHFLYRATFPGIARMVARINAVGQADGRPFVAAREIGGAEQHVPDRKIAVVERVETRLVVDAVALRPLDDVAQPVRRPHVPVVEQLGQSPQQHRHAGDDGGQRGEQDRSFPQRPSHEADNRGRA